jgi:hypothetical protein
MQACQTHSQRAWIWREAMTYTGENIERSDTKIPVMDSGPVLLGDTEGQKTTSVRTGNYNR